jgi:hypothetical protein
MKILKNKVLNLVKSHEILKHTQEILTNGEKLVENNDLKDIVPAVEAKRNYEKTVENSQKMLENQVDYHKSLDVVTLEDKERSALLKINPLDSLKEQGLNFLGSIDHCLYGKKEVTDSANSGVGIFAKDNRVETKNIFTGESSFGGGEDLDEWIV